MMEGVVRTYTVAAFSRDLERRLNPLGIRIKVSYIEERGLVVETWRLDRRYARTPFTVPTKRLSPLVAALGAQHAVRLGNGVRTHPSVRAPIRDPSLHIE